MWLLKFLILFDYLVILRRNFPDKIKKQLPLVFQSCAFIPLYIYLLYLFCYIELKQTIREFSKIPLLKSSIKRIHSETKQKLRNENIMYCTQCFLKQLSKFNVLHRAIQYTKEFMNNFTIYIEVLQLLLVMDAHLRMINLRLIFASKHIIPNSV